MKGSVYSCATFVEFPQSENFGNKFVFTFPLFEKKLYSCKYCDFFLRWDFFKLCIHLKNIFTIFSERW